MFGTKVTPDPQYISKETPVVEQVKPIVTTEAVIVDPVKNVGLNVISKEEFERHTKEVFAALGKTLAKSFGPYGAPTIIYKHPFSHVTKDGFTIAMSLSTNVAKSYTNQAVANMATDICGRMNNAVGDGTTTAIVATNNIYQSYMTKRDWFESNGVLPRNILTEFIQAKKNIREELEKHAVPIHLEGDEDDEKMVNAIRKVVSISSNEDEQITETLTNLYKEFGYPSITCEKSVDGIEHVEIVNGYRLPLFITDEMYINSDDQTMRLVEADVLVFTCKVTDSLYDNIIAPALINAKYLGHHLLLCCPSIDEVLLDRVIAPMLRAEYKQTKDVSLVICCYKAASSYQRKTIDDFAMLCHTTPIDRALATAMIRATSVQETGTDPKYSMVELLKFYRPWAPTTYPQINTNGKTVQLVSHLGKMEDKASIETELKKIAELRDMGILVPGVPVRDGAVVDEALILDVGYCRDLELGKKTSIIHTFFYDKDAYNLHYREATNQLKEIEAKYKKLATFNTETTKAQERLFSLGLKLAHIEVGGDTEMAIGMRKDVYDDAIKAASSAYKYGIINGCNVSTIIAIESLLSELRLRDEDDTSQDVYERVLLLIQDGFIETYKTVLRNWIPEDQMLLEGYYDADVIVGDAAYFYQRVEEKLQKYTKQKLHTIMQCNASDALEQFTSVFLSMVNRAARRSYMFETTGSKSTSMRFSLYDFLIEWSIQHNVVFDVVQKKFSSDIVNSFQTDDEILTATTDLISLLISGNQMIVTQRNSFEV